MTDLLPSADRPFVWPPGTAAAIGRSLRLYRGRPERDAALDRLYAPFVPPGGLAFDVGAHVGDRTACFRRLGARVVAVDPQPSCLRALRLLHRRDPGVTLVGAAVDAAPGEARMRLNTANPTVSTLSGDFVDAARGARGWQDQVWDRETVVTVTTLDALVVAHGRPDFIKIDVEGLEDRVLSGLSAPVPALSFEFTTLDRGPALRVLAALPALGRWRLSLTLGDEAHALDAEWTDPPGMAARIATLPDAANSGDVYAVWEH
jgi:FkbM family methyltransferase